MALLLEHIPDAAGSTDRNGKLPLDYLLAHPDADTVGGQVSVNSGCSKSDPSAASLIYNATKYANGREPMTRWLCRCGAHCTR
jgi:hypothetical protein